MSTLLISRSLEHVDLYLAQNKELNDLLEQFKTDPLFSHSRGVLWELRPGADQGNTPTGLFRLREVGKINFCSAAEAHFREALYYAEINGNSDEVEVLGTFARVLLARLKLAQARKEAHQKDLLNPTETQSTSSTGN